MDGGATEQNTKCRRVTLDRKIESSVINMVSLKYV